MKLFKLAILAVSTIFLFTGCSEDTQSPEQLAKKPIYNEEKEILYKGINQLLPQNSSLILPSNSKEVGKINKVDLNGDGVKELIVFEKKENLNDNTNEVGFMILSESENEYTDKGNILQEGDSIEYANFYDLNNDGNKEIILVIKENDTTYMHIYNFVDDEIKKICSYGSEWIENSEDFHDMKVKIGYIDDDNILDILILNLNPKNNEMYASIVNFDKNIKLKDYVKFENVKNLNNSYITIDNVAKLTKDKMVKGVILDIPNIKDNTYITQILYLKDGKLYKAFSDYDRNIAKAYYIPAEDINKDGIIDIPIVVGTGNTYNIKSSANTSWYRWNGKMDESSGLLFTSQIYYSYQYNYKLLIPNNLVNKIIIEPEYSNDNVLFKFYYYDIVNGKPKKLFTISAENKVVADDSKGTGTKTTTVLEETEDYRFVLYPNNIKEMERLDITNSALREYFSLIYE